jgi:hypothetical protein
MYKALPSLESSARLLLALLQVVVAIGWIVSGWNSQGLSAFERHGASPDSKTVGSDLKVLVVFPRLRLKASVGTDLILSSSSLAP